MLEGGEGMWVCEWVGGRGGNVSMWAGGREGKECGYVDREGM